MDILEILASVVIWMIDGDTLRGTLVVGVNDDFDVLSISIRLSFGQSLYR